MAYTLDFTLSLGSSKAGLTDLRAQLVDTAGNNVGSAVATGFVDLGTGTYLWHYAAIPDSHRGAVKFYSNAAASTILAVAAVNPEEAEQVSLTKTDSTAILADTNELQVDLTNGGRLDLILDATLADTNELQLDHTNGGRLDLIFDAILADTNELQTDWVNGGRLDLILDSRSSHSASDVVTAIGNGSTFTAIPWNATWDAEVQSECADALNAYDPPTNAEMVARTLASADYATATNLATVAGYIDTEIQTIIGYVDCLPATWVVPLDAAGIRAAVGLATANLDTQLGDIPTVAEFTARSLPTSDYATSTALTTVAGYIDTEVAAILANTNELQTDLTNGGRLDLLIDAIKAKTDNLPASPAAVGSAMTLTAAYDAAKTAASQTSVDDLPTNAELAAALAAADDAVLLAVADIPTVAEFEARTLPSADYFVTGDYTIPLDAAGIRGAIGLASANLDTQLADLPTVAEFEARTLPSADYFVVSDYMAPLDAAGVRGAIGMASANLDTQLSAIAGYIDTEIATIIGYVDCLPTSWVVPLDAAGVRSAVGLASANLDTQLADLPTVAEFELRTLPAADYFVTGDYTAPLDATGIRTALGLATANLDTQLGDIPTVTEFNARTLVAADYFVVSDYTAPLDAAGVRGAIGLASANLDTQLADIPTTAEFNARTLAAADYATAASQTTIAGYIDTEIQTIIGYVDCLPATWTVPLDAAGTRTALGLASANLDTQLADLPTVTEFNARTLPSADYFVVSDYTAPPTTAEIKTAMEVAGGHLSLILEDTGTTLPATLTTIAGYVDCLPATWVVPAAPGDAMALTLSERNSTADVVLGRSIATCEATASEWSLATLILAAFESTVSGTTWNIKRTDGSTPHFTKTVVVDSAADPIVGVS